MAIGKNIKGITIEFNGDTTKLGKVITAIDKQTKSLDKDIRAVDKALKFNPGNTELLAQKQQLLGQKVDETKKRLEALKTAQAELDDDPAVDKTSQDYMELRREIIETESKLKHFEQQARELNNIKLKALGDEMQKVGDKMKAVGEGMTKYVTGPIVAAGAASVAAFKEVDAGLDIVTQKTGATGKELDGMHEIVKNIAASVPADFETIGTAVGEVNTRFGLTGDALESLSTKFVQFAKLNNTDVNAAIDTTQKAMAAFGMSADEAEGFLDVLNKVGQETGVDMNTLSQSLVTNAAALKAMGFNSTEAANFVGQLEKSGIDASTAMAGLQKALVNGAKEGKTMGEVLAEIQSSIVNAGSDTEALAAATEIFGAKAAPKMSEALRSGALDLQALSSSSLDAADSVNKTFEQTLDPADKFTMALNQAKITGYEVGATLLDILVPALDKLSSFLKAVQEKWDGLSPGMKDFIIKAAMIAAAVGPVLVIIGSLITKVGMLLTFLPALAGALPAIGAAFSALAGPVGIAIAAIAALIAIGVALYKHWDQVKEFLTKCWDGIKAACVAVFDGIKAYFQTVFTIYKTLFTAAFTALKNIASATFEAIKKVITAPIEGALKIIKAIIEKIKALFNFKVSLPKIKLPHFSIKPKGWQLGDLLKGKIPTLGIDWYAQGGIFASPSVIGVGEAGPEAVLPIEKLQGMLAQMADNIVNGMLTGMQLQGAGSGGEITIPIYLYPSGPKMGEETVKMYDQYKRILG